jgi:23S rRNA (adenine2503-C2)-methyltransferase
MSKFLAGQTLEELTELSLALGEKAFRARQLFELLHRQNVTDLAQMTVLPGAFRAALSAAGWQACSLTVRAREQSRDGTVKLGLATHDGHIIETVLIPMETGKHTQCISSQVGCALGCRVCMTATLGFTRNLAAAEIIDQVRVASRDCPDTEVRNLVFMGMGEPLHNVDEVIRTCRLLQAERGRAMAPRRITVSTAGVVPAIATLGAALDVQLATSLNAPTQAIREQLMPIARKYPLQELLKALKEFARGSRHRLTMEYVLVAGVNDQPNHARELVRLLSHLRCKVNLIPFNPFPGTSLKRPSDAAITTFATRLEGKDLTVTIRQSKGQDIQAACGQLAGALGQD